MPRGARKKSSPGVYHLLARGLYKQRIFNDEENHLAFLEKIRKYKKISGYKVFDYCLMSNHIQLLDTQTAVPVSFASPCLLDWTDAFISAQMLSAGQEEIYSYDRDFDRVEGLTRLNP
jgi:hypothetical protein